jgi:arginine utilization regulatory protein
MHSFGLENLTWGMGNTDLLSQIFDDFDTGVIIMNVNSEIVFYNQAQGRIDDIDPAHALGKSLLDLYKVGENASHPALTSIFSSKPLSNQPCYYYTHQGKLVNSVQNIFPLVKDGALVGCIAFTSEYGKALDNYEAFQESQRRLPDKRQPDRPLGLGDIITEDKEMLSIVELIKNSSDSLSPVMFCGETGTGKDMFARIVHNISARRDAPFLAVNCASFSESLLDGLLFGTEEGAFTGARTKPGLFEMANGGTLFLDGIHSMPISLQGKLLRAVEERRTRRVGGTGEYSLSLKIVSATTVNPREAVAAGSFRPELMLKLGVVQISIPPLRARQADIPLLTASFLSRINARLGKGVLSVAPEAREAMQGYLWPGNVQELFYTLESAIAQAPAGEERLSLSHFNSSLFADVLRGASVPVADAGKGPRYEPVRTGALLHRAAEVERIAAALEAADGNAAKAARSLKISPQLMNYKLKKFSLKKKITVHVERAFNQLGAEAPQRPKAEPEGTGDAASGA